MDQQPKTNTVQSSSNKVLQLEFQRVKFEPKFCCQIWRVGWSTCIFGLYLVFLITKYFARNLKYLSWDYIKPSLSCQWSLVPSFIRDFVCIIFVWLTSLWEKSYKKLMQKKSCTNLRTKLHWLERLGFCLPWSALFQYFCNNKCFN